MNMTVINKSNNERYNVYDISYDKACYPHFLIYKDGQWLRMSAKYFRPISIEDLLVDRNSISNVYLSDIYPL